MEDHALLFNALIYLLAAVIAVPLSKRVGLGSVLGYLIAGAVIGPWGIGLITNVEDILHFSEFGVVLLLFVIGLELDPRRLWAMRRSILGVGGAQMLLTALLLGCVALLFQVSWQTALIGALGLALSSTAIALQTLTETGKLNTRAGQSGFAVLLFQDIAVIPLLAILPLLAVQSTAAAGSGINNAAQAFAVIGAIILLGRYLVSPLLRFIAATGLREIFTAFSLLLVIGISLLVNSVGLSMALGAFLAGVVLADSEYRHALEIDIEPFKGLLMGLFFISVGMSVDLGLLTHSPLLILGLVFALVAIKFATLALLGRLTGLALDQNLFFAILLSQGGEFGFVLFAAATQLQVIESAITDYLIVVVTLSMVSTPLLMMFFERVLEPKLLMPSSRSDYDVESQNNPVIIAGFGRFGQIVGRLLHTNQIGTTILDYDPKQVAVLRKYGFKVFYGDASRIDLLRAAGASTAQVLVLATDDRDQILDIVDGVKKEFPHLKIVARAWDMLHAHELLRRDVTLFQRETFAAALNLGEGVLREIGFGAYQAKQAALRFQAYDQKTLQELFVTHRDEPKEHPPYQHAQDGVEELFEADEDTLKSQRDESWG